MSERIEAYNASEAETPTPETEPTAERYRDVGTSQLTRAVAMGLVGVVALNAARAEAGQDGETRMAQEAATLTQEHNQMMEEALARFAITHEKAKEYMTTQADTELGRAAAEYNIHYADLQHLLGKQEEAKVAIKEAFGFDFATTEDLRIHLLERETDGSITKEMLEKVWEEGRMFAMWEQEASKSSWRMKRAADQMEQAQPGSTGVPMQ